MQDDNINEVAYQGDFLSSVDVIDASPDDNQQSEIEGGGAKPASDDEPEDEIESEEDESSNEDGGNSDEDEEDDLDDPANPDDEADDEQEEGEDDAISFLDEAREVLEGTDSKRKTEVMKGLRKRIQAADAIKQQAGIYVGFEMKLAESKDSAKTVLNQLLESTAKHYGIDVTELIGRATADPDGEGTESDGDGTPEKFSTKALIDSLDENAAPNEIKLAETLGSLIEGLQKQNEDLMATVKTQAEQGKKNAELEAQAAQLKTAYGATKTAISKGYNEFTLKSEDYLASVKAYPNLPPKEAVILHLNEKLMRHMSEAGRKTAGKPRTMVKKTGGSPNRRHNRIVGDGFISSSYAVEDEE